MYVLTYIYTYTFTHIHIPDTNILNHRFEHSYFRHIYKYIHTYIHMYIPTTNILNHRLENVCFRLIHIIYLFSVTHESTHTHLRTQTYTCDEHP